MSDTLISLSLTIKAVSWATGIHTLVPTHTQYQVPALIILSAIFLHLLRLEVIRIKLFEFFIILPDPNQKLGWIGKLETSIHLYR